MAKLIIFVPQLRELVDTQSPMRRKPFSLERTPLREQNNKTSLAEIYSIVTGPPAGLAVSGVIMHCSREKGSQSLAIMLTGIGWLLGLAGT